MLPPTTLAEAACLNARNLLASVVRSFRRAGDFDNARMVLRNARVLGTYPFRHDVGRRPVLAAG